MVVNSPYLKPIANESMIDRIIDRLVGMIVAGDYRPGDQIPTENELSALLGVGRNSVREAIKVLIYLGVLEIRRAEGTFVCEKSSDKMLNPLLFGLILEDDSSNDILELRRIFDMGILELALSKMTPKKLSCIEEKFNALMLLMNMPNPDPVKLLEADLAFHSSIEESVGNKLVSHVSSVIIKLTYLSRKKALQRNSESPEKKQLSVNRHRAIFDALKNKDSAHLPGILKESYAEWITALAEEKK